MPRTVLQFLGMVLLLAGVAALAAWQPAAEREAVPHGRREVVFWHFWGGEDRAVVEEIVRRFNESQNEHFVRAIAMPGNNLDLKFFLSVTGGDPPDVLNQDDPIVADWAARRAIVPLSELASADEIAQLESWLFPAARRLGTYDGQLYALCNGLDIRALYYNRTMLDEFGLDAPQTVEQLDEVAARVQRFDESGRRTTFGYLPDPRRIWAWGIVFGGQFYDEETGRVTCNQRPIVEAVEWMADYRRKYGAAEVASFRQGDQSLPGKAFPLLAGRYAIVMDGQWRVRDIAAFTAAEEAAGRTPPEFGVAPLPPPASGGRKDAGWVNGNFFLVPRGARNPAGAWAFMKFWSGFGGHELEAAKICAAGGWIPASPQVVEEPAFQKYLAERPLFVEFIRLAGSENQVPTPVIPGAPIFYKEVVGVAETALYRPDAPPAQQLLDDAARRIQARLDALQEIE